MVALPYLRIRAGAARWVGCPSQPYLQGFMAQISMKRSRVRHRPGGAGDRHDALLPGLAQGLADVAVELGQLVQEEDAVVPGELISPGWSCAPPAAARGRVVRARKGRSP